MGDNPAADTDFLREDLLAAVETLLNAFAGPLGLALPGTRDVVECVLRVAMLPRSAHN